MIKPRAMRKLPECDRCLLYSYNPFLSCAVHPAGPTGDSCLDFRPDPDAQTGRFEGFLGLEFSAGAGMEGDETPIDNPFDLDPSKNLWEPEGARFVDEEVVVERDTEGASHWEYRSFYNGEEIIQPRQRWTREEQLDLLDWHPMFTGRCPACELPFPRYEKPPVHWDCPQCGWVDDTV